MQHHQQLQQANCEDYKYCNIQGPVEQQTMFQPFTWPMLEYAAPVRHPELTREQLDDLELVQRQHLPTLLPDASYGEALQVRASRN